MRRIETALAGVGAVLGLTLALYGLPELDDVLDAKSAEFEATLSERTVHLDPAEVNTLLHDDLSKVMLIDVQDEASFNLFHLVDATRRTLAELRDPEVLKTLDPKALKIIVARGEAEAERAWKLVTAGGIRDAYVLSGGLGLWLAIYRDGETDASEAEADGDRRFAAFETAQGALHPFARPEAEAAPERSFTSKAKRLTKVAKPSGGCGG